MKLGEAKSVIERKLLGDNFENYPPLRVIESDSQGLGT